MWWYRKCRKKTSTFITFIFIFKIRQIKLHAYLIGELMLVYLLLVLSGLSHHVVWRKSWVPHLSGEYTTLSCSHWKLFCKDCCKFYLLITRCDCLHFRSYDEDTLSILMCNVNLWLFWSFLFWEVCLKKWTELKQGSYCKEEI